jgi:pimeloyl-ACP methyl ester carboxylesterase
MHLLPLLLAFGVTLPSPSGTHTVGTSDRVWLDTARSSPVKGRTGREIVGQVWYPAQSVTGKPEPYIPRQLHEAVLKYGYYGQPEETLKSWAALPTHSYKDAAPRSGKHPVLLFEPGLGTSRHSYTLYFQELASHGYVVVALEPTAGCFTVLPDGTFLSPGDDPEWEDRENMPKKTREWAQDFSFVLEQLKSDKLAAAMDLERVGAFGHSMGGASAMELLTLDRRVKAVVNMDGLMHKGLIDGGSPAPALRIGANPNYNDEDLKKLGRTREQWDEMRARGRVDVSKLPAVEKSEPILMIALKDTGHFSFSDAPYTMPTTITRFSDHPLSPKKTLATSLGLVRGFFDAAMSGGSLRSFANDLSGDPILDVTQVR